MIIAILMVVFAHPGGAHDRRHPASCSTGGRREPWRPSPSFSTPAVARATMDRKSASSCPAHGQAVPRIAGAGPSLRPEDVRGRYMRIAVTRAPVPTAGQPRRRRRTAMMGHTFLRRAPQGAEFLRCRSQALAARTHADTTAEIGGRGAEARVTPRHSALAVIGVSLERKPISVPEFWVGGLALATVALIACRRLASCSATERVAGAPTRYARPYRSSHRRPRPNYQLETAARSCPTSLERRPTCGRPAMRAARGSPQYRRRVRHCRRRAARRAPRPAGRGSPGSLLPPGRPSDASAQQRRRPRPDSPRVRDRRRMGAAIRRVLRFSDSQPANSQPRNVPDRRARRRRRPHLHRRAGRTIAGRCRTGRKAPLSSSAPAPGEDGQRRDALFRVLSPARLQIGGALRRHAPQGKCLGEHNIALEAQRSRDLTWSSERGTATSVRCKR